MEISIVLLASNDQADFLFEPTAWFEPLAGHPSTPAEPGTRSSAAVAVLPVQSSVIDLLP